MKRNVLSLLLALIMVVGCIFMIAPATKAAEETQQSAHDIAQAALDSATDGTVIELEAGATYGILMLRPVEGNANTVAVDYRGATYRTELERVVSNLTIKGNGATVGAILLFAGYDNETNTYCYIDVTNLTIENVVFSAGLAPYGSHSYAGSVFINLVDTKFNGITVKDCTLTGSNNKLQLVYAYGHSNLATDNTYAKNLTITGCTVDGVCRLAELREIENVTITNNTIKNTTQHGILLSANKDQFYSGNVVVSGNTASGIHERFLRAANLTNASVTVTDNTVTDYAGADDDFIKVTEYTELVFSGNTATPKDETRTLITTPEQTVVETPEDPTEDPTEEPTEEPSDVDDTDEKAAKSPIQEPLKSIIVFIIKFFKKLLALLGL